VIDEEVAAPSTSSVTGDGEVVLVIDDEPTIRMLIAEVLAESGYAVIEAPDGAVGMRVLESNARIDLLITDVGLPGGLNGRQVADAARVNRPDLKVLFITGYAENAVIGRGRLDHGMFVLTKPFQMEVLADVSGRSWALATVGRIQRKDIVSPRRLRCALFPRTAS
jgi:CheY-like chemotaxis protein